MVAPSPEHSRRPNLAAAAALLQADKWHALWSQCGGDQAYAEVLAALAEGADAKLVLPQLARLVPKRKNPRCPLCPLGCSIAMGPFSRETSRAACG